MKVATKLLKLYLLCWIVYVCSSNKIQKHNYEVSKEIFGESAPSSINLVIAHPDDEVMFFAPSILQIDTYFPKTVEFRVICLTDGGADGLGNVRAAELQHSMLMLLPNRKSEVIISDFKDGMAVEWDLVRATKILDEKIRDHKPLLITFDKDGVSGHVNHISCFTTVQSLKRMHPGYESYSLVSSRLLPMKYSAFIPELFGIIRGSKASVFLNTFAQYIHSLSAMTNAHISQMVWFRYGWWVASSFVFTNELQRF